MCQCTKNYAPDKSAIRTNHAHCCKRPKVFCVAGELLPIGRKMVDDTLDRGVQRLNGDQGEKQNQQNAILDPSRTCQREHGTTNRKRQGHMAKRGFLPQPPNATKRVSYGREKMRDARDPLRFWARCVGCICQNFQLSAAYGVCLTGLDQFYLSRRLLCRQGQMKTDD